MSLRLLRSASRPVILLIAIIFAGLIAWPGLWPMDEGVRFRTAPFVSGHEAADPAEFHFALAPPLA